MPGQQPRDRHDIVARVFKIKITKLMNLLVKGKIFGIVRCHMYSVEWQKRGLPHVHILLWLEQKITPDQIDSFISAEIPDVETDPTLHNVIVSNMIHGPCGSVNPQSPCMNDGKCSKRYPRTFVKETQTGEDGYPTYRRRSPGDGGLTADIKAKKIDNRWVVPYCPLLSKTFAAHINVEYCNSVKSIKYVCKYINKGSDQATFELATKHDEVCQYQTGRYISTSEAVWRIFSFSIHERYPSVIHLAVHLENYQRVYFTQANANNMVLQPPDTTLTAFFKLCRSDAFDKTLLYCDVPSYYTWSVKAFNRRKQGAPVLDYPGFIEALPLAESIQCIQIIRNASSFALYYTKYQGPLHFYLSRRLTDKTILRSKLRVELLVYYRTIVTGMTHLMKLLCQNPQQ